MTRKYDSVPLKREDRYGEFRAMAIAEGYVMARRKGCAPFVVTIGEWINIGDSERGVVHLKPVPQ